MKKHFRQVLQAIIITTIFPLIYGCAMGPSLEGQPYFKSSKKPSNNEALVYIYRPYYKIGSALSYDVSVDKNTPRSLPTDSYTVYSLSPGSHEFNLHASGPFNMNLKGGTTTYIEYQDLESEPMDNNGLGKVTSGEFSRLLVRKHFFRWAKVTEEEAIPRLSNCRLTPTK